MSAKDPLKGLTDDHCRYVLGDPQTGDWHYCRAPRARHPDGRYKRWKWCDKHRAIVVSTHAWGRPRKPLPVVDEAA